MASKSASYILGEWTVDAASNRISNASGTYELEPRVMDLLMLFVAHAGQVISKADIVDALWQDIHVNDDAITRTIFKLRKALGDDAKSPIYIETVSKRGYRLIAEVSTNPSANKKHFPNLWLVLIVALAVAVVVAAFLSTRQSPTQDADEPDQVSALILRADGFYSQFTRSDNEAAARIYESILAKNPEEPAALAGLSNTITQRVIRYQGPGGEEGPGRKSLTEALDSGWLDQADAKSRLRSSVLLARQATVLSPTHTRAWRALGLAQSGLQDFAAAEQAYAQAMAINPKDWGTMINLSELSSLTGRAQDSVSYLTQAWFVMEDSYAADPVAIRPWHSAVGTTIAEHHLSRTNFAEGKEWFERVLTRDPLNAQAVRGLAQTLQKLGDPSRAKIICDELEAVTKDQC